MLAILEKSLPPYTSYDFGFEESDALQISGSLPGKSAGAGAKDPACFEEYVPSAPVTMPQMRSLDDPLALCEARDNVAAALEELRQSERALENHLRGLRAFMSRSRNHSVQSGTRT